MSQTRRCGPRTTDGERFESFSKLFSTTEARRDQRRQRQTERRDSYSKKQREIRQFGLFLNNAKKTHTTFEKAFESGEHEGLARSGRYWRGAYWQWGFVAGLWSVLCSMAEMGRCLGLWREKVALRWGEVGWLRVCFEVAMGVDPEMVWGA